MEAQAPSSWFDDPEELAGGLREALREDAPPPAVPGVEALREIGRGGQGVVYAGVQTATRRTVAVKVLSESPGRTRSSRLRFEREIEVAAALDDPRLVRVCGGGTTEAGRPYVVMECVEGVRCDAAPAVLAARETGFARPGADPALVLFAEIAEAVDAAHRRGVIHRDLKPSNILVDARGLPHVVDFGLAKASGLGPDALSATGAGALLGSLPWTSPEQAAGRADEADVRSDVYALGATFFHAVAGAPPVPVGADLRTILEAVARAEAPSLTRLSPAIDRDLAAVVARTLEKAPERRYATAGDLARDLRRILAGEPIEARRETAWRALAKAAVRRRRAAFAFAAATLAAVLLLLYVGKLWRLAEESSLRAERSLAFFLDSLGAVDPSRDGPATKLVDALDRISGELDSRFPGNEDAVRLRFRMRLRDLYLRLGRPDRALAEAEAVRRGATPSADPAALRSFWNGEVVRALALYQTGRTEDALALYRDAERALAAAFGDRDVDRLGALNGVGLAWKRLRRNDEAQAAFAEIIAATSAPAANAVRSLRANALENLAHLLEQLGRPAEAEAPQREAYALFAEADGPTSYGRLNASSNLGQLLLTLDRPTESVALLEPTIGLLIERFGPRHPLTLGTGHNYGVALLRARRRAEAEKVLRDVYQARVSALGPHAADTLTTLNELTFALPDDADPREVEALRRTLLDGRRARRESDPLDYAIALNNFAGFLRDAGRPADAAPYYDEATNESERLLTKDHWIAALLRGNRARNCTDLERFDEAEAELRAILPRLEAKLGAAHDHVRGMHANLERNAARRAAAATRPTSRATSGG